MTTTLEPGKGIERFMAAHKLTYAHVATLLSEFQANTADVKFWSVGAGRNSAAAAVVLGTLSQIAQSRITEVLAQSKAAAKVAKPKLVAMAAQPDKPKAKLGKSERKATATEREPGIKK